jgi:hypothetical protein
MSSDSSGDKSVGNGDNVRDKSVGSGDDLLLPIVEKVKVISQGWKSPWVVVGWSMVPEAAPTSGDDCDADGGSPRKDLSPEPDNFSRTPSTRQRLMRKLSKTFSVASTSGIGFDFDSSYTSDKPRYTQCQIMIDGRPHKQTATHARHTHLLTRTWSHELAESIRAY